MRTTLINVKVDPKMKEEAQKIASELGLSLSTLIHAYLKEFIRTKEVHFRLQSEEKPSQYLLDSIRESEREIAAGETYSFDNSDDALAFLDEQINKSNNGKS